MAMGRHRTGQQLLEGLRLGFFVHRLYHLSRLLNYTFTSFT